MRDNSDTSPNIIEVRHRAGSAQDNLNIELGLLGETTISESAGASQGNSSSSFASGSALGNMTSGTGGSGAPCFTGEALLYNGDYEMNQRIADVVAEDEIIAFRQDTGEAGICAVLDKFKHEVTELLRVEVQYCDALYVTPNHRFWTGKEFKEIGVFKEGEFLPVGIKMQPYKIASIHKITLDKPITVYNITTEWGTYFINGIPVSNAKRRDDDIPS